MGWGNPKERGEETSELELDAPVEGDGMCRMKEVKLGPHEMFDLEEGEGQWPRESGAGTWGRFKQIVREGSHPYLVAYSQAPPKESLLPVPPVPPASKESDTEPECPSKRTWRCHFWCEQTTQAQPTHRRAHLLARRCPSSATLRLVLTPHLNRKR